MVVLNRKLGERLVIDDEIVITGVAVQGNQVRLGIDAPPSVGIWREELLSPEAAQLAPIRRHVARPAETRF